MEVKIRTRFPPSDFPSYRCFFFVWNCFCVTSRRLIMCVFFECVGSNPVSSRRGISQGRCSGVELSPLSAARGFGGAVRLVRGAGRLWAASRAASRGYETDTQGQVRSLNSYCVWLWAVRLPLLPFAMGFTCWTCAYEKIAFSSPPPLAPRRFKKLYLPCLRVDSDGNFDVRFVDFCSARKSRYDLRRPYWFFKFDSKTESSIKIDQKHENYKALKSKSRNFQINLHFPYLLVEVDDSLSDPGKIPRQS